MESPPGAPEWLAVHTAAEQPELWEAMRSVDPFDDVWPEYNVHGNRTPEYFGALVPRFAQFQMVFVDQRSARIVARGRTIPFAWDGSLDDLPEGIDALGLRAIHEEAAPTALSALAAEVVVDAQRRGLSAVVISAMASLARVHGLHPLVAPVRPSQKDRYPITPIDRYAEWRRADGLPFDPWMRVHARLGGRVLRAEPRSLFISGSVEEWESWTAMAFPEDGTYVFPKGLATLSIADGVGEYWEPNVWMVHDTRPATAGADSPAPLP